MSQNGFNSRDMSRLVKHPQGQLALHTQDVGKMRQLVDEWNKRERKDEFNRYTRTLDIPMQFRQNPFSQQSVNVILPILQRAVQEHGDKERLARMALKVMRDAGVPVGRIG